jgi:hypothetical protein
MIELAETALFFYDTKIPVALGTDEVVGGDRDGGPGWRLRLTSVDRSQGQDEGADDELGFHGWFPFEFSSFVGFDNRGRGSAAS